MTTFGGNFWGKFGYFLLPSSGHTEAEQHICVLMLSAARINKLATSYLNKILCRNGCETVGSAPEDPGSNQIAEKILDICLLLTIEKTKTKKKRPGMAH